MAEKTIQTVLKKHTDRIMNVAGVVGVGQGLFENKPSIVVMAASLTPEIEQQIPDRIEGFKVDIQVTGEIRAL